MASISLSDLLEEEVAKRKAAEAELERLRTAVNTHRAATLTSSEENWAYDRALYFTAGLLAGPDDV